jgi:hypothetical protein
MKAILVRGGLGRDGELYNKKNHVYSYSVGIDGPIIDDLKELYPALAPNRGAVK